MWWWGRKAEVLSVLNGDGGGGEGGGGKGSRLVAYLVGHGGWVTLLSVVVVFSLACCPFQGLKGRPRRVFYERTSGWGRLLTPWRSSKDSPDIPLGSSSFVDVDAKHGDSHW